MKTQEKRRYRKNCGSISVTFQYLSNILAKNELVNLVKSLWHIIVSIYLFLFFKFIFFLDLYIYNTNIWELCGFEGLLDEH